MIRIRNGLLLIGFACLISGVLFGLFSKQHVTLPTGRQEVVFWHFWGGRDRSVVDHVVQQFNDSQNQFFVRAVAMPGNNLQAKLFLAVTGGDPPDLVNQDDPILADWAQRGVIQPIETVAKSEEITKLDRWMFQPAQRLSKVNNRYYAICNGLDIRALYYNKTLLEQEGLQPPRTLQDLDQIAAKLTPDAATARAMGLYAYLPDSRRLWAWGYVFGGQFYDATKGLAQVDSGPIQQATRWMADYGLRYGPDNLAAFRQADQSLPGKPFPLLPIQPESMVGRYGLIMDGQWRTRDIVEFTSKRRERGLPCPEFGVCPLPSPTAPMVQGRSQAGWVNGNFFVVPAGANCPEGAWEFMQFWIGLNQPKWAAQTCAAGGWIPVSQQVVETETFQQFLIQNPLFATFVELANSPNQFPTPVVPGAAMFKRTVEAAAYEAMSHPEESVTPILKQANQRIQLRLERARSQ